MVSKETEEFLSASDVPRSVFWEPHYATPSPPPREEWKVFIKRACTSEESVYGAPQADAEAWTAFLATAMNTRVAEIL